MENQIKEELQNIFEKIGGSVNMEEDLNVLKAIVQHPASELDKIDFLVIYSRDLERMVQTLNQNISFINANNNKLRKK